MIRRALLLSLCLALGCRERVRIPKGPRGKSNSPAAAYETLLKSVVSEDGRVDYPQLKANRAPLDRYVGWIAQTRPPHKYYAHMAYFINVYNAFVLYGALEENTPESLWNIRPFPNGGGRGFFKHRAYKVWVDRFSLFEIKHEQLRLKDLDFRIHAALNDGSMNAPPLSPTLYTGKTLHRQLDKQTRRWLSDPSRGVRFDKDTLVVSPIIARHQVDFEEWSGGESLCTVLSRYAPRPLRPKLNAKVAEGCPFEVMPTDHRLNQAAKTRTDQPVNRPSAQ